MKSILFFFWVSSENEWNEMKPDTGGELVESKGTYLPLKLTYRCFLSSEPITEVPCIIYKKSF